MKFNYITHEELEQEIERICNQYPEATQEDIENAGENDKFEDGTRVDATNIYSMEYVQLFAASLDGIVNE